MLTISPLLGVLLWLAATNAHIAPYHRAMYCFNGNVTGLVNENDDTSCQPMFNLTFNDFWLRHWDSCDQFPPPNDTFLELPAGGNFELGIVSNRAFTEYSFGGKYQGFNWPDGGNYPDDYNVPTCIGQPNMHTQNQSMAAGTAFAISYEPKIENVKLDNLVVFTVTPNTPWKKVTTYQVPAAMPPCPPEGCFCTWLWVPDNCGEPNQNVVVYKCRVVNSTSTIPLAPPTPAVWCEGDPGSCTQGPKQIVVWNQLDGNNTFVEGFDQSGQHKSPGYNLKMGFHPGAQNDIFQPSATPSASNKRDWQDEGLSSHRRNNVRRLSDDGHW